MTLLLPKMFELMKLSVPAFPTRCFSVLLQMLMLNMFLCNKR